MNFKNLVFFENATFLKMRKNLPQAKFQLFGVINRETLRMIA